MTFIKKNKEDPKFKVGDHVRILKYKTIFGKGYPPLKTLCCRHVFLVILTVKKLLEHFTKRNCQKKSEKFRFEKVIKRIGDRLYVKWKGYNYSFNSWIGEKDKV